MYLRGNKIVVTRGVSAFFIYFFILQMKLKVTQRLKGYIDKNNTNSKTLSETSQSDLCILKPVIKEIPHLSLYLTVNCKALQQSYSSISLWSSIDMSMSCATSAQSWCQQVERIHSESSLIPSEQACFQYWGQHTYTPVTNTHQYT